MADKLRFCDRMALMLMHLISTVWLRSLGNAVVKRLLVDKLRFCDRKASMPMCVISTRRPLLPLRLWRCASICLWCRQRAAGCWPWSLWWLRQEAHCSCIQPQTKLLCRRRAQIRSACLQECTVPEGPPVHCCRHSFPKPQPADRKCVVSYIVLILVIYVESCK